MMWIIAHKQKRSLVDSLRLSQTNAILLVCGIFLWIFSIIILAAFLCTCLYTHCTVP
jgi:hypothetical protein